MRLRPRFIHLLFIITFSEKFLLFAQSLDGDIFYAQSPEAIHYIYKALPPDIIVYNQIHTRLAGRIRDQVGLQIHIEPVGQNHEIP